MDIPIPESLQGCLDTIPIPNSEVKYIEGISSPAINCTESSSKPYAVIKVCAKELIQQKLHELKQKAREEGDKLSQARTEQTKVKADSESESDKIISQLFEKLRKQNSDADLIQKGKEKVAELSANVDKLNLEIAELEKEHRTAVKTIDAKIDANDDDRLLDALYEDVFGNAKKRKKRKSGKDKKKHKKKKKKLDDPELDPKFFDVPSPEPLPEGEKQKKDKSRDKDDSSSCSNSRTSEYDSKSHKHSTSSRQSKSGDRKSRSHDKQSRSRDRRSRSRSKRSRSQDRRSRSRENWLRRSSRSISRDRHRHRNRSPNRSHGRHRSHYHRSRSHDRNRSRDRRRRSRSRERKEPDKDSMFYIDKEKLRRIAIKRVAQMEATGHTLSSLAGVTAEDIAQIKAGGGSLNEITAFCQRLARHSDDESSGEEVNVAVEDGDEVVVGSLAAQFIGNKAAPIKMNIKNAKEIPIKTTEEKAKLRSAFPVSCGNLHRGEDRKEWKVVPANESQKICQEVEDEDDGEDIGILIARRVKAVKKLKTNPECRESKKTVEDIDKKAARWSHGAKKPGEFTGKVETKFLTPDQLAPSEDKKRQAWLKKDIFTRAAPISGGIGKHLLKKMGWSEGEGLGVGREGALEPLMLDFNTSRQGLTAPEERSRKAAMMSMPHAMNRYDQVAEIRGVRKGTAQPIRYDLTDKNPISVLMEICSKRRWSPPSFELVHQSGPSHKRNFLMQVTVNGTTYQPSTGSNNKKISKSMTAIAALQAMGLLPKPAAIVTTPAPQAAVAAPKTLTMASSAANEPPPPGASSTAYNHLYSTKPIQPNTIQPGATHSGIPRLIRPTVPVPAVPEARPQAAIPGASRLHGIPAAYVPPTPTLADRALVSRTNQLANLDSHPPGVILASTQDYRAPVLFEDQNSRSRYPNIDLSSFR